ncbi:Imm1 family immunity protein [Actinosynnema sp. NPDC023587]|uniref:Imm1 family immunity protein n=1 Tax=Actinosynnema sp. NPDC023587 TaxID=3154695 RepID=UPI0033D04991
MVDLEAWYDEEQNDAVTVRTPAELDAVLDTVAGWDGRIIVHLKPARPVDLAMRRMTLDVGVHGDTGRGALVYTSPNGLWFSKAESGSDSSGGDRILYYYMNSDTEYPVDCEIPLDVVRRAAHEYLTTGGQRPTAPTWQEPPAWYPTAG